MISFAPLQFQSLLETDPEKLLYELQPHDADEWFAVALSQYLLRMPRGVMERSLREALRLNLRHLGSHYLYALSAFERNAEQDGRRYFRRAIQMDPQAAEHVLYVQRELKSRGQNYELACRTSVWCLKEVEALKKATAQSLFHLGKILFEQGAYQEACQYLERSLEESEFASEASEYLSYIFEQIYRGEELIQKTLDLAEKVKVRSDLFFNLAMVCQHEQKRSELALHFFYLASLEDPQDPGLRFSLEQEALEVISAQAKQKLKRDPILLTWAHLYQGSLGLARAEFEALGNVEMLKSRVPERVWNLLISHPASRLEKTLAKLCESEAASHVIALRRS